MGRHVFDSGEECVATSHFMIKIRRNGTPSLNKDDRLYALCFQSKYALLHLRHKILCRPDWHERGDPFADILFCGE